MRIIQFSDTHISHLGGVGHGNTERLVGYLNEVAEPDLVVNTGDVVILDPGATEDRDAAMRIHERIVAPLRVLPGNHDVGECAPEPWRGIGVSSRRVRGFRSAWGSDRFVLFGDAARDAEAWAFVGINSELCASGLPEEDEQWAWLKEIAAEAAGRSVMLFLHKPLVIDDGTRESVTVAAAARERILGTFRDADLRVVANGHVHRYRCATDGDVMAVWAPSLSFSPAAEPHLKFGPGTAGIVEYSVRGRQVGARFVEVPGIEGVADFFTLPEVEQSMEALGRRST
ncbi:MAG TPA: metallophosphoesterase [bacterium]|nr:metallophosphoesterase [bacterium]